MITEKSGLSQIAYKLRESAGVLGEEFCRYPLAKIALHHAREVFNGVIGKQPEQPTAIALRLLLTDKGQLRQEYKLGFDILRKKILPKSGYDSTKGTDYDSFLYCMSDQIPSTELRTLFMMVSAWSSLSEQENASVDRLLRLLIPYKDQQLAISVASELDDRDEEHRFSGPISFERRARGERYAAKTIQIGRLEVSFLVPQRANPEAVKITKDLITKLITKNSTLVAQQSSRKIRIFFSYSHVLSNRQRTSFVFEDNASVLALELNQPKRRLEEECKRIADKITNISQDSVVSPEQEQQRRCANCGATVSETAQNCASCGEKLQPPAQKRKDLPPQPQAHQAPNVHQVLVPPEQLRPSTTVSFELSEKDVGNEKYAASRILLALFEMVKNTTSDPFLKKFYTEQLQVASPVSGGNADTGKDGVVWWSYSYINKQHRQVQVNLTSMTDISQVLGMRGNMEVMVWDPNGAQSGLQHKEENKVRLQPRYLREKQPLFVSLAQALVASPIQLTQEHHHLIGEIITDLCRVAQDPQTAAAELLSRQLNFSVRKL